MLEPQSLRQRRPAIGLIQAGLAAILGVAANTAARWERGDLNASLSALPFFASKGRFQVVVVSKKPRLPLIAVATKAPPHASPRVNCDQLQMLAGSERLARHDALTKHRVSRAF